MAIPKTIIGGEGMSILLSDQEIEALANSDETCVTAYMVAKAAAIHAVQYLEGKCAEHPMVFAIDELTGKHPYPGNRYDCPICMKQIHEQLEAK
jgi:hypothetical protein